MSGDVEMRDYCPQCGELTWLGPDIGMVPPAVADEIERLRKALQLVVDQLEEGLPKSAQRFAMDALGEHLMEARRG